MTPGVESLWHLDMRGSDIECKHLPNPCDRQMINNVGMVEMLDLSLVMLARVFAIIVSRRSTRRSIPSGWPSWMQKRRGFDKRSS